MRVGHRENQARALLFGILVSMGTATGTTLASESAPCFTSASTDSAAAVVGETVLYRVRIGRRSDVISAVLDPPNFSPLGAEWLEGRPESVETRDGAPYRIREEHIALRAAAPVSLTLGPASLRCATLRDGVRQTTRIPVPAVPITIFPLPTEGQPAGFTGLVGAPSLVVTVTPRSVSLGETVRVAVLMRGAGNLWDADDPLPALGDAEIFRQRPVLRLDRGATLSVSRHFIYDVVPRAAGEFVIPTIVVPYFDPTTKVYTDARANGASVDVTPRRPARPD